MEKFKARENWEHFAKASAGKSNFVNTFVN